MVKGIAPNFAVTLMLLSLFPESFGIFIVDRVVCGKSDGNIKDADGQV